jgi:hypothetical protein
MGWLNLSRQQEDFRSEAHTGIGIEFDKGKNCFIEDDISRDINPIGCNIKTLEAFVHIAVAKKNTLF